MSGLLGINKRQRCAELSNLMHKIFKFRLRSKLKQPADQYALSEQQNAQMAYVEMRISYLQTMVGKFQPPYAGAKETVDYAMTELEIFVKFQNIDSSNFLRFNN
ncbi:hypothetical protein RHMOL_Rhmol11G0194000 [Rhododendron molle]|uniref:Uncharacterized protein n=1 Tax=Rhododendron molle TaxID=49168 RepID=A0ACC0LU49_RHOML|nr:hypothetical protein RHMOL_Rhmol11G0194000 [Rhododendron molle]